MESIFTTLPLPLCCVCCFLFSQFTSIELYYFAACFPLLATETLHFWHWFLPHTSQIISYFSFVILRLHSYLIRWTLKAVQHRCFPAPSNNRLSSSQGQSFRLWLSFLIHSFPPMEVSLSQLIQLIPPEYVTSSNASSSGPLTLSHNFRLWNSQFPPVFLSETHTSHLSPLRLAPFSPVPNCETLPFPSFYLQTFFTFFFFFQATNPTHWVLMGKKKDRKD